MQKYKVAIAPMAFDEVQEAIGYYNYRQSGLGKKFLSAFKVTVDDIRKNPFFQIRYDEVRCLLVRRFPYMIHFTINEKKTIVYIHAVVHTSLNPEEHWLYEE